MNAGAILLLLLAQAVGASVDAGSGPSYFRCDAEPLTDDAAPPLDSLDAEPL